MNTGNVLQKIWALPLVMLLAAFMSVGSASAQDTYYVDLVTGDDNFNGSQMAVGGFPNGPFATIAQAVTTATDDDTIVILAGDYTGEGVLTVAEDLTLEVRTSGGNVNLVFDGFTIATAGKSLTLAQEDGSTGVFISNADNDAMTLTAGNINVTGALTFASGATVTRANGTLTGNAPTATNLNVTYNGALTSAMQAGNELPASIGTGALVVSHTGAILTIPNALSAASVQTTSAGAVTFSGNLTTTGGAGTDVNVDGTGTVTVSGTATIAGGVDVDGNATMNWGATSIAGAEFNKAGTGTATLASLDLTDQNVTVAAGTLAVTGDLRVGVAASGTRVANSATLTAGSITSDAQTDATGSDQHDLLYVIDNNSTLTVSGAITEGALAITAGSNGENAADGTAEYSAFTLDNADGATFSVGANSTIRGDINNVEDDAGVDGQGIVLTNNAVLTVQNGVDTNGVGAGQATTTRTRLGDFVNGTLVLDYALGGTDAPQNGAGNAKRVTLVNNLTFGPNSDGVAAVTDGGGGATATVATLTVGGDLRIQKASTTWEVGLTVTGTVFIEANNVKIDASGDKGDDSIDKTTGVQGNWGGLNVGSSTGFTVGTANTDATEDVTITGTTAIPGPSVFGGFFKATNAAVTTLNGFESDEFAAASHTASTGTTTVGQANGAYDVSGAVVVSSGATLSITSAAATDDAGSLDIDGTLAYTSTGTMTVSGDTDIDGSTGSVVTAGAANFTFGGDFTGGTWTDTGGNDDLVFNTPSDGLTVAVKPGTSVGTVTVNGSGRTATFTESITASGGITLGNDVTVALGANSFVLNGGDLTLTDDAVITNSGENGSVQFTGGATQDVKVTGTPTTNPTLQNIVVNNAAAAPAVNVEQDINIAGTLTVLNGVVQADNATVTFTGSSGKIAYAPESQDPIATNGTGSWAGTRDLDYIGTLSADRAAGAEFTATNIRNLTVSASGNNDVNLPNVTATITGNLTISSNGADLSIQDPLTVNGNATINGDLDAVNAGDNLSVGGALTVADGANIAGAAAMEVRLTGNSQTHSIAGFLGGNTTLSIEGTGTTVNGAVATAGDADGDAEILNLIVDAGNDVTFNTMQVVNGTVTVNGTATLNMVTDGDIEGGSADGDDGQIKGAINVNNGGSLTVSTTSANAALASTTAVDDGGTFIAGSNLTAVGDITVGDASQAAAATFNLNGNTVTTNATAAAITATASTGATAPGFGTSGTLNIPDGGEIAGGTNPTIPNLTINGGAAIDSDVTVTGTFTVAAPSSGEDTDDVTLSGANAVGQFNANYTGTAGAAGSTIVTTGTSINSTVNGDVTITNLQVASTSNTTMAYNGTVNGGATNFRVAYLDHDSGVLDITDETFTFVGDGGAADEWDYDGGSYAGTGTYVVAGAAQEIDMSTNGATVSIPNMRVQGAAGTGLELDAAGDGITVTGTLTLDAIGAQESGTAVSNGGGAGATIQLAAASNGNDDYYNGATITLTGGAGAGQSQVVTDYDAAGGATANLLTVGANWNPVVDNTTTYSISFPAVTNIQTEVGGTDATFSLANGATLVRNTIGAGDHFQNAPTLGTGMTVRYASNSGDVTTGNELPTALTRLEWENANDVANNLLLEDGVALTLDQLEMAGNISIDEDDDGNNSITINDGGRIEYDGGNANFDDQGAGANEVPSFAGTSELQFNAGFGATATTDLTWPDALTPSMTVGSTGGNVNVTMHESRSVTSLTVGDGNTTNTSTMTIGGGLTVTVSGAATIAGDGTVTGGTLDANGTLSNTGALTSAVRASQSITLTGGLTSLTLDGTTAQTLTVPATGANLTTFVVNNTAGATVSGGNIAVGTQTVAGGVANAITGGLTLTNGVLNLGSNSMLLSHAGSGIQGYTRTNGCVYGNVRKQLSNTTSTAPADRLEFPLCSMGGVYRPYAITFNNPNTIGGTAPTNGAPTASAAPAITVKHDVSGENSVAELSGTNGLPQTVGGVSIARYPSVPSFFWTVSPSFTMSPSLSYDTEMRGNDYPNFTSSCDTSACDINEIYPIRRHVGSSNNLWSVASATIDNFLAGSDDPVVIGRSATGALQTSGTVFTYGLKSIFAAATGSQSYATTTGNTHVVDVSSLFTGYTGSLTYTAVASDASGVTSPALSDITGNNLTVTGGADAGSATVSVTATNSFGGSASATFSVTNAAALSATTDDLDRSLNVSGTSDVTYASVFSGGAGTVAYSAASSDASVTVASDGTKATVTAASNGSATVTLTAVDGSSTPVTVTKTFTVTANANVSVAAAIADMSVEQGKTADVDVSGVFANGTGAITVTVSGGDTVVGATISGSTVTVSGLKAYDGSPLADTAPVTITLTGTDTLGGSTTDAFDVTVTPVLGDLDGSGAPSAASASLALDAALGIATLTANQQTAVDFNGDSAITAYDAALIFAAAASAKVEPVANPAVDLVFGEISFEGDIISIPVQVAGEINDVVSASFATRIDPALATIAGITSDLTNGWMVRSVVSEDGTINLAVAGLGGIDADGTIATINVQLTGSDVQFNLDAEGAVNNNPTMALDAVEVAELPESFTLHGNYPNPFNPTTSINFDLPESADVEIQVIDMIGRQVMLMPASTVAAGANRTVQINASQLASGTYFYRVIAKMESKTLVETGRMMLVK